MRTVHFWEAICFTFIHIVLCFSQHTNSPQANDVIKHCVNFTNWPSCSYAYRQVYESLTKPENSFNISHALYPGRAKPSFLVRVNVYGPNKTTFPSPAKYTWSISCLYASVPGLLLEILSLGSILVTSRTQELNIQIPPFCCNISDDNWTREEIIGGFLTRALIELQDLAVSPSIRDSSLNTAECVIQGHKPNFEFTGRTANIRVMLWLLPIFVVFSGPLLALYIMEVWDQKQCNEQKKKNRAKAICTSFCILSVLGTILLFVACTLSWVSWIYKGQATFDIPITFIIMILWTVLESCFLAKYATPKWYLSVIAICGANTISYLFCWLIIGIRINPAWGLTIALIVLSHSAALTYARYVYLEATHSTGYEYVTSTAGATGSDGTFPLQVIFFCVSGCLAVVLLFFIVLLAGQSYSGKEMAADEVLKTTTLYFISAFISWVTWNASQDQSVQNSQPTSNETPQNFTENGKNTPSTSRQSSPGRSEKISSNERNKTSSTSGKSQTSKPRRLAFNDK